MQYDFSERHLFRLEELEDYEVSGDDPDVRGWSVLDNNGEKIGVIRDLIVDPNSLQVRYLDVIAVKEISEGERHLLIPIGAARIDEVNDVVKVPELDKNFLASYPEYTGGVITRNYEHDIREKLSTKERVERTEIKDEDFYKDDLYNESGFYYPRRKASVMNGGRQPIAYTTIRRREGKEERKI